MSTKTVQTEQIVYRQVWLKGLRGRIIKHGGQLIAQVESEKDVWTRASTRQATSLFRNALAVRTLQPGDAVVAWAGNRLVLGNFVSIAAGEYEVSIGQPDNLFTLHLLPLYIAQKEGIWPFRQGMQVAAYVQERWVKARWAGYNNGRHVVRLADNALEVSDRAHTAHDALELGLIE